MAEISDFEFAKRCSELELPGFLELRKLLGSDLQAVKALRAEIELVETQEFITLHAPSDGKFATRVRAFMVTNKLEWNKENLLNAVREVMRAAKANCA